MTFNQLDVYTMKIKENTAQKVKQETEIQYDPDGKYKNCGT